MVAARVAQVFYSTMQLDILRRAAAIRAPGTTPHRVSGRRTNRRRDRTTAGPYAFDRPESDIRRRYRPVGRPRVYLDRARDADGAPLSKRSPRPRDVRAAPRDGA